MKPVWMCGVASVAVMSVAALAQPAAGATKCTMKYSLAGWSAGYSTASGSGTITCDNGSKTVNGSGTFSEVADISELFGRPRAKGEFQCISVAA